MDSTELDQPDKIGQTEQKVIGAVLGGDSKAYRTLVVENSAMVFRVAYRITRNEADAEEVVQEAFLRGYQKLASFQGDAAFRSWIYRIAVNCAYDLMNRNKRSQGREGSRQDGEDRERAAEVEDGAADESPDPERLMLSNELGAQQATAMHALTPLERSAFLLRHVEEQSTAEIAEALGVGHSAAKQAVFRAVQKLRTRLGAHVRSKVRSAGSNESEEAQGLREKR